MLKNTDADLLWLVDWHTSASGVPFGIFENNVTLHFHFPKQEAATYKDINAQGHLSLVCLLEFYLHFSYIKLITPVPFAKVVCHYRPII